MEGGVENVRTLFMGEKVKNNGGDTEQWVLGKQEGVGLKTLVAKLGLYISKHSWKTKGNCDTWHFRINFLDVIGSKLYIETRKLRVKESNEG